MVDFRCAHTHTRTHIVLKCVEAFADEESLRLFLNLPFILSLNPNHHTPKVLNCTSSMKVAIGH